MSDIFPDCMMGPSEPCIGFAQMRDAKNARIAELEATLSSARMFCDGPNNPTCLREELSTARAEIEALRNKLAEAVEAVDLKDKELIQERGVTRALRKRVEELEGRNKHMETVLYDAQVLLGTEDIGELITGPTGPISRLIARAEQAEAQLAEAKAALEDHRELHRKNLDEIVRTAAQLAEAKEQAYYANGVADLAIKHRNEAEAQLALAREALAAVRPHIRTLAWNSEGDFEWLEQQVDTALQQTAPATESSVNRPAPPADDLV